MKIDGCVAVVTDGAQGIGKAITKALLQNNAKVTHGRFCKATWIVYFIGWRFSTRNTLFLLLILNNLSNG